jgi:hypothetical protein
MQLPCAIHDPKGPATNGWMNYDCHLCGKHDHSRKKIRNTIPTKLPAAFDFRHE